MKNKTLIFLISLMGMLLISGMSINAETELANEQTALLKATDVYDESVNLSDTVSRSDFAGMIYKIIPSFKAAAVDGEDVSFEDVSADNENYESIGTLKKLGIINGVNENEFYPNEEISYQSAITIAVRVLGYEEFVKNNNSEYLKFANEKKLTKGVNAKEKMSAYDAYVLIYNLLNTDISDLRSNNSSENGKLYYMEYALSLHKIRGVVCDDGKNSFDGKSYIGKNEVQVERTVLKNDTGRDDLLGLEITGYYKHSVTDDEARLISAAVMSVQKTVIDAEDIESYENYTYTYRYDSANGQRKKIKISKSAVIVYNGSVISAEDTNFKDEMLVPYSGTVTVIAAKSTENNLVIIEDYKTYIVKSVDVNKNEIYVKHNQAVIKLDETDVIYNKNNEKAGLSSILNNNVLSVLKNLSGEITKIVVSSNSAEDAVKSVDYQNYRVVTEAGGAYKLSQYFIDNGFKAELSKQCKFFFDVFDRVAYIEMLSDDEWIYGYLYGVYPNETGDKFSFRIINKKSDSEKYEFADKVQITKTDDTVINCKTENIQSQLGGYKGIIRFKTNDDDKVNRVELPLQYGMTPETNDRLYEIYYTLTGEELAELPEDEQAAHDASNFIIRSSGSEDIKCLGGPAMVDKSTLIYFLSDTESDTYVSDSSYLPIETKVIPYKAYGTDKDSSCAKIAAVEYDELTELKQEPMVISEVTEVYDSEEQEVVYKVSGRRKNTDVSYFIKKDNKNITDVFGNSVMVERGDIVKIQIKDEYILNCQVLYDFNLNLDGVTGAIPGTEITYYNGIQKGNPLCYDDGGKMLASFKNNSKYRILSGYVYSFANNIMTVTTQNLHDPNTAYNPGLDISKGYFNHTAALYSQGITVSYDRINMKLARISADTVRPYTVYDTNCSRCVIITAGGDMRGLVIYNEEEEVK